MIALADVHVPLLLIVLCTYDVRSANERRWGVYALITPPVTYLEYIKYTTGGQLSVIVSPFPPLFSSRKQNAYSLSKKHLERQGRANILPTRVSDQE